MVKVWQCSNAQLFLWGAKNNKSSFLTRSLSPGGNTLRTKQNTRRPSSHTMQMNCWHTFCKYVSSASQIVLLCHLPRETEKSQDLCRTTCLERSKLGSHSTFFQTGLDISAVVDHLASDTADLLFDLNCFRSTILTVGEVASSQFLYIFWAQATSHLLSIWYLQCLLCVNSFCSNFYSFDECFKRLLHEGIQHNLLPKGFEHCGRAGTFAFLIMKFNNFQTKDSFLTSILT